MKRLLGADVWPHMYDEYVGCSFTLRTTDGSFFFFFCSYSLRVDYREDLVGDCLTEMVGNAHHVYL